LISSEPTGTAASRRRLRQKKRLIDQQRDCGGVSAGWEAIIFELSNRKVKHLLRNPFRSEVDAKPTMAGRASATSPTKVQEGGFHWLLSVEPSLISDVSRGRVEL
jgi:hypothetical protein